MDRKNRTVMVVGLGRFGASIARTLSEDGVQVLGIDRRMDLVESLQQELTQAVQADSMDRETLHMLGAGDFDTAFVTIGGDLKASCATTMLLKELGCKQVIAKASDEFHGRMLEKLGADKVLFPERDMGKRIAHNLVSGNLLEYIELSPDFSMVEIQAGPEWNGKALRALNLRERLGINVVAVRSGGKTDALPTAETVIHEGRSDAGGGQRGHARSTEPAQVTGRRGHAAENDGNGLPDAGRRRVCTRAFAAAGRRRRAGGARGRRDAGRGAGRAVSNFRMRPRLRGCRWKELGDGAGAGRAAARGSAGFVPAGVRRAALARRDLRPAQSVLLRLGDSDFRRRGCSVAEGDGRALPRAVQRADLARARRK